MSDYPTARDCRHGSLARSCQLCENEEEIATLTAERTRLRALVLDAYMEGYGDGVGDGRYDEMDSDYRWTNSAAKQALG